MTRTTGALVLLLAACQGPASSSSEAAPESLVGIVDLEIGLLDGPDAYVFGQVSGVVEDAAGRIFVADYSANEIRAFDAEGVFLFSVGREGQGPGELRGPCCLTLSPEGELWVRDGGNRRYVGYRLLDDRAEPFATLKMAHSDGWYYAPLSFAPGGGFMDTGYRYSPEGVPELQRFHLDSSGNVLRTESINEPTSAELGTVEKGDRRTRLYFPQPYGPRSLVAFGPDGMWATAVSSHFSITVHEAGGTTRTITGDAAEGPPLSTEERASAERRIESYVRTGGGAPSDYPEIPSRKPPLASLMFDRAGQLWASFNTAESLPARAVVYDREAGVVGERTWPRHVNLAFPGWIGRSHALGITSDSLGVQQVVRVRFGR